MHTDKKNKAFQKITGNSLGHNWPIPFSLIKWIWGPFRDRIDRVFKMTGDLQISSQTSVSQWSTELLVSGALPIEIDIDGQDLQLAVKNMQIPPIRLAFMAGFLLSFLLLGSI